MLKKMQAIFKIANLPGGGNPHASFPSPPTGSLSNNVAGGGGQEGDVAADAEVNVECK